MHLREEQDAYHGAARPRSRKDAKSKGFSEDGVRYWVPGQAYHERSGM